MVQAAGGSAFVPRTGSGAVPGHPTQHVSGGNATRSGAMTAPSGTIRGRTKPPSQQLRAAPSSGSLRSKASNPSMNTASSSATISSTSTSATSLNAHQQASQASSKLIPMLSVLPLPEFPSQASLEQVDFSAPHILSRLLQIVEAYSATDAQSAGTGPGDLYSACFYARLALNLDPACVPARRTLALALLHGASSFPFGPAPTSSGSNIISSNLANAASTTRSGAHAAIELLKAGPSEIFQDVGCARTYAAACSVLGRWQEAGEVLEWAALGDDAKDLLPGQSNPKAPEWQKTQLVMKSQVLVEAGYLALRSDKHTEAANYLRQAREMDASNWSAWVALCDLGRADTASLRFVNGSTSDPHAPRTFYAAKLAEVLQSEGYDEVVIKKVGDDLQAKGEQYFEAAKGLPDVFETQSSSAQSSASSMTAVPMVRTASKRTVMQAIAPSPTPSSSSSATRPGSRTEAPKRMRTMPAAIDRPMATANRQIASGRNANAAVPGSTTQQGTSGNVASSRLKSLVTTASSLTNGSTRVAGTLSASRTNAQARSTANVGDRLQDGSEDLLKSSPRRSARTNSSAPADEVHVAPISTQPQSKAPRAVVATMRRPVASRPAPRPAPPQPSTADSRRTLASGSLGSAAVKGPAGQVKPFVDLVQRAATAAAHEAALWNAADDYINELVTSLARAYDAIRNGQSRLALALLRAKGPLSNADEEALRKEAALASLALIVEEGKPAKQKRPAAASVQIFGGLGSEHRDCAEVQCLIGRAYHYLGQYHLAGKHFEHARRNCPSLMANMDIYSLTLFHLQHEVELSRLSREMADIDPGNAVSYIAAGNLYALQREHSHALDRFQRACRAAPTHAYAFTLAGYEANELGEREKSVQYFREAIKVDKRHWNAFAGLGQIHLQEHKIQAAAYYYGHALDLHRTNAVLWDVYGRVKMALGNLSDAERAFALALRMDERSAMSHVKMAELLLCRASVERQALTAQSHRDRAHEHLLRAVRIAPDEAHVHLMLAKSYMDKGQGRFAILLQNRRYNGADANTAMNEDDRREPQEVDMAELATLGSGGAGHMLMQQQQQIRATGRATLPTQHRAEIARHLSIAVDLNPRLARYVKAMGEGARAALRGAAARLTGDMGENGTAFDASLLPDELTEGVTESMLQMDEEDDVGGGGGHGGVLEDPSSDAETEVMLSETGVADGDEFDEEHEEEQAAAAEHDDQDMTESSQEQDGGDSIDPSSRHGLGLSLPASGGRPRGQAEDEEQDVSMSF